MRNKHIAIIAAVIAVSALLCAGCAKTDTETPKSDSTPVILADATPALESTPAPMTDAEPAEPSLALVMYVDGQLLVDDVIWVSSGDTELIAQYGLSEDDMDNDYALVNESRGFVPFALAEGATFSLIVYDNDGGIQHTEMSLAEFAEAIAPYSNDEMGGVLAEITKTESGVERVEQIYVP